MHSEADEEATLQARLREIARPGGFVAGPRHWPAQKRMQAGRQELRDWDAAHPDLAAEYAKITQRLEEIQRRREEEWCQAEERQRVERGMAESEAGHRNLLAAMSPLETPALGLVREWMGLGKVFLLMTGSPSGGKSVAATWAMRCAVEGGRSAWMVRAVEESRQSLYSQEANDRVKRMRRVGMLVIDDMGTEMHGEVWKQTLDDVIDARYQSRLSTVMTSNLEAEVFAKRYGERIAERIRHDGMVVNAGNVSLRKSGVRHET